MAENESGRTVHVVPVEDPYSGSSLVPMLIGAMVMIVVGMVAVWGFA